VIIGEFLTKSQSIWSLFLCGIITKY